MTEEEKEELKRDEEKRKARLTEIAKMSDGYLKQLAEDTRREFYMLHGEIQKRERAKLTSITVADGFTTLRELENAIHAYGDHKGFDGLVQIKETPSGRYEILVKEG